MRRSARVAILVYERADSGWRVRRLRMDVEQQLFGRAELVIKAPGWHPSRGAGLDPRAMEWVATGKWEKRVGNARTRFLSSSPNDGAQEGDAKNSAKGEFARWV